MLNVRVFRKKRFYIIVMLSVLGYGLWCAINDFLYIEQKIVYRQSVNTFSTLYITESSAGATTSNVYKFYVYNNHEADDDFLKKVKNGYEPFLVTTDPDVNVNIEGNSIHLKVRGDIFKFTHAGGNVFIYMNSSPF